MKLNLLFLFLFSSLLHNYSYCQSGNNHKDQIRLEFEFDQLSNYDSVFIITIPASMGELYKNYYKDTVVLPVIGKKAWCSIQFNEPVYLDIVAKGSNKERLLFNSFIEPGDSLVLHVNNKATSYSGNNIAKYLLQEKLKPSVEEQPKEVKAQGNIKDIDDYREKNQDLNKQLYKKLAIIDSMKSAVSEFAYQIIRIIFLNDILSKKAVNWGSRLPKLFSSENWNMTEKDRQKLISFFDEDFYLPEFKWLRSQAEPQAGSMYFVYVKFRRDCLSDPEKKNVFDITDEGGAEILVSKYLLNYAAEIYTGMAQEACMANVFFEFVVHDNGALKHGFAPEYDSLMNQYYNSPFDERFKKYVKGLELYDRSYALTRGSYRFNTYFSLLDDADAIFDIQKLKGKASVIRFWKSGQQPDNSNFETLYNKYSRDTNIVFLNINVDKDKTTWLTNLKKNNYLRPGITNLFTEGVDHPLVHALLINTYPKIFLGSSAGFIKRADEASVATSIGKELSKLHDGPYVFHSSQGINYYLINNDKASYSEISNKDKNIYGFRIGTDEYNKSFTISLQAKLAVPPSVYSKPSKLLVLSDIEGNFDAFRKLLQSNKVIDKNYNWIFGKGHLVFAGDMFDRGEQVTECLWLVYALEQKAKAAGGYVHFILGNHEIMNLQGDHRYVKEKYKTNAALMGKSLTELYGEKSELGKWLRTKNIIEKIGDLLFCHGGISPEINNLNISISDINQLARPHYADTTKQYNDPTLATIMSSSVGPFWYRSYYKPKVAETEVDSTLKQFNVSHIITGHTVVSDTISTHYHNKVLNTDTKHADSKSEALLIEGNKFYRVNDKGERHLLFVDDKRKWN